MAVALRLAVRLGMCESAIEGRVVAVLEKWGLPTRWGAPDLLGSDAVDSVREAMLADKKRKDGVTRLILPRAIGRVEVCGNVSEEAVVSALAELQ
jgi:3-dehydroquinate synthetase